MAVNVYKLVFAEFQDFTQYELDLLETNNIMVHTDYGTVEIMRDTVIEQCIDNNEKVLAEILSNRLGKETYDMLINGDIDFILMS